MTDHVKTAPSVSVRYAATGASKSSNEMGMRAMQERAWMKRGEQYLLIKSPPASGKSRALMFIALDKLENQGLRQAIIVVPERSIGASFRDTPLSKHGFWADWKVAPQWNLCNAPGADDPKVAKGKVDAVRAFLASPERVLVCTHATFRFAVDDLGVEAFDDRLIAIDEFHHVSANPDNRLGAHLRAFMVRDRAHVVAMTGSYFRGDSEAVLMPEDEARFETVTYTYYEQLNGYEYLKSLDIGYYFYAGRYLDAISEVLDPSRKTIVHIPNVNARESLGDKIREAEDIMHALGTWKGADETTGFQLVERPDGTILKVADLVDDDGARRDRVIGALKDPKHADDRDHVDIILALGMAKEGFDWIWCEHALTVGYRSSLTEIVQIIGRATRDAPGKTSARFTNLIAEPDASEETVNEAVNDTLKAIAASLLMEQVLAPKFQFTPKSTGPKEGYDYGEGGYQAGASNVGFDPRQGQFHIEIGGLVTPKTDEGKRICEQDINEVLASFIQDRPALERGVFDDETPAEELTQLKLGRIIADRYPDLPEEDREAVRQHAVAAMTLTQKAKEAGPAHEPGEMPPANTAFVEGVRRFVTDVRDLEIDLIDRINPVPRPPARSSPRRWTSGRSRKSPRSSPASGSRLPMTRRACSRPVPSSSRKTPDASPRSPLPIPGSARWPRASPFSSARRRRMSEKSDLDILAELGVEPLRKTRTAQTPREARIIAGFEDIQKFVDEHGHPPRHGSDHDIFERLYAVRLDRLRSLEDCRVLLADIDHQGLLTDGDLGDETSTDDLDDEDILAALEVSEDDGNGLTTLRHVRSQAERRAAEDVAVRQPCPDFDTFKTVFDAVRADLASGARQTRKFEGTSEIEMGRFFIVDGLTAYVAEAGEPYINDSGNRDRRLRVIFDNGTESNLLARSLQKALTQDPSGRRVTELDSKPGPLFEAPVKVEGTETGTIYVLRSRSDLPEVAERREVLHKIGVTGGPLERRFVNASKDPTFLMADVELVASYRLVDINRSALENLLHRFFSSARLEISVLDRFGQPIRPREWFIVPLAAVREAVDRIQDGTLHRYDYRPELAALVER